MLRHGSEVTIGVTIIQAELCEQVNRNKKESTSLHE
jgi:hypothetical protein